MNIEFLTTFSAGFYASSKHSGSEFSRTFLHTFLQAGTRAAFGLSQLLLLTVCYFVPVVALGSIVFFLLFSSPPASFLFVLL